MGDFINIDGDIHITRFMKITPMEINIYRYIEGISG